MNGSPARNLALAAILILVAAPVAAQARDPLAAGDWIRARHQRDRVEGRVVSLEGDVLILARDERAADTLSLPALTELEVSTGRRRNTLRGMGIGFLALGATGAVLAAATWEPCTGWLCIGPSSEAEAAAWGLIGGGAAGVIAGGIIGVATHRHVWAPVERPVRFGLAPAGRGRAVALVTVAF